LDARRSQKVTRFGALRPSKVAHECSWTPRNFVGDRHEIIISEPRIS
jgi:hypothetical protein